jgi:tRNA dimethylallyltransferase
MSEWQRQSTEPAAYNFIKIGLSREREELYRLIEDRVDTMMDEGLLEETKEILKMKPAATALQAIGYKEIALYFEGSVDLNEAVRLTKKRTKMFAKRQFTWFKKEPGIQWIDITGFKDADKVFAKVINDVKILTKHLSIT